MTTNPYFNLHKRQSEQHLIDNLIIESIKIHGFDIVYIKREKKNLDLLFGEDSISEFNHTGEIEMFIKNVDGFDGDGDIISKFGLEIRDRMSLLVSVSRWEQTLAADEELVRPREGDLIYFPFTKSLYEVKFVENESVFYQSGELYMYELRVEEFAYSNQQFNTGYPDIDMVEDKYARPYVLELTAGGTGTYQVGEEVYQGSSLATATAKGVVLSYDAPNRILQLKRVVGDFQNTTDVIGETSGAVWTQFLEDEEVTTNPLNPVETSLPNNDEIQFEQNAKDIIDFSEKDPFSEGKY